MKMFRVKNQLTFLFFVLCIHQICVGMEPDSLSAQTSSPTCVVSSSELKPWDIDVWKRRSAVHVGVERYEEDGKSKIQYEEKTWLGKEVWQVTFRPGSGEEFQMDYDVETSTLVMLSTYKVPSSPIPPFIDQFMMLKGLSKVLKRDIVIRVIQRKNIKNLGTQCLVEQDFPSIKVPSAKLYKLTREGKEAVSSFFLRGVNGRNTYDLIAFILHQYGISPEAAFELIKELRLTVLTEDDDGEINYNNMDVDVILNEAVILKYEK